MAKSLSQELAAISADNLNPLYFLHGAESYYPNAIAKKIAQLAIPEHEKGFNEFILFGKELTVGAVLNNARRFPMMAEKQLVLVKDAELIQDIGTKDAQNLLTSYANEPLKSTILVLVFGKAMDVRKAFVKAFDKNGVMINAKKLYDNQVPDFIMEICQEKKHKISPKAAQLLFEHIGNNLEAIVKEIEKMLINLPSEAEIDGNAIEKYVGISKDYNVFELQKALTIKDIRKSFQIVNYFAANTKDHPIQPVILILYNFFSKVLLVHGSKSNPGANLASLLKVNPYFVKDYTKASQNYPIGKLMNIISALRNADKHSKGIETGTKVPDDMYKDLINSILY
ncbi:DNA polymerase III subunit delta [Arcticibacterium luteifluviistationis]|uniref:DNA polymerase III subunit delta n=1 Tax=Arcticibacterium luteifluviistationis TaxID=1784714 RepID=A0A2Z4G6X5_9BACT|nr:DNA polymerase III subunit delta [Arcticibacterium luteifluviistationis]AWV96884.1 DNA polymerase III subunit delta [Arcticibacterium luteifluviistationis]